MTEGQPYISGKGTSGDITNNVKKTQTVNTGTRYPRSILRYNTDKARGGFTQRKNPLRFLNTSSRPTPKREIPCWITAWAQDQPLWRQSTRAAIT